MVDQPTMTDRTGAVLAGVGLLIGAPRGDVGAFGAFLAGSPVPAVLLLTGALLTGFSVGFVAYLSAGAIVEALIAPAIR